MKLGQADDVLGRLTVDASLEETFKAFDGWYLEAEVAIDLQLVVSDAGDVRQQHVG